MIRKLQRLHQGLVLACRWEVLLVITGQNLTEMLEPLGDFGVGRRRRKYTIRRLFFEKYIILVLFNVKLIQFLSVLDHAEGHRLVPVTSLQKCLFSNAGEPLLLQLFDLGDSAVTWRNATSPIGVRLLLS